MLLDAAIRDRLSRVRKRLLNSEVDALLFLDMRNIRYLTGFTGSDGALLVEREQAVLLVDGRYITQARGQARQAKISEYRIKLEAIAECMEKDGIKAAGFEATAISYEDYVQLKEKIPQIVLVPKSDDGGLRSIKDAGEVNLIREACAIASRTLTELLAGIKPGIGERDIALELEYRMRQNGAEGVSFPTICASGANAALPHASPGTRKLMAGDAVVIDFGAVYEGYHSDETYTFFLGSASSRQRELYGIVKEAHDRAIGATKAGVPCSDIDRIARDHLEAAGVGKFFSHGTGHGVGLDVHEPPRIAAPSKAILEAGMVVTIEPGVYLPGEWGIRIEDTVLVNKDDCEVLTKIPKDFALF